MKQNIAQKETKTPFLSNENLLNKKQSVQFKDNRPEAITQLKHQELANTIIQKKENKTGIPNQLKSGIESLSGIDISDVKVHYNSSKPAQLQAHAYAQGSQIHLGPGQEKHLPHEAWHVVQQKQGRVKPTKQLKGKVSINDDDGLEREADVMGAKALQPKYFSSINKSNISFNKIHQFVSIKQFGKKKPKSKSTKEVAVEPTFNKVLKASFSSSAGNGASRNVGAGGGGGGPFIIAGVIGTRHHIYPKSALRDPALMVSKGLIAYEDAMSKVSGKERIDGQTDYNSLKALGNTIGLNNDGSVNTMAGYYWNRGIHFYGVNSGYRTDDPGSNPEPFKPRSLSGDKFQRPKAFGAAMQSVMSNIANIGSSGKISSSILKDAKTKFNLMNSSGHMGTHTLKGDDWTLSPKPSSVAIYNGIWGAAYKRYALNRTGANVYKSYPDSQLAASESASSEGLKTSYDLSNVGHSVRILSVFGVGVIGAVAKTHVDNAIAEFNLARIAVQPHLVFDHMKNCLDSIKLAKGVIEANGVAAHIVGIFDTAIQTVTTVNLALTDQQKEDIALSR